MLFPRSTSEIHKFEGKAIADQPKFVRVTVLEQGLMINHDVLVSPGNLIEIEEDVATELIGSGKVAAAAADERPPLRLTAAEEK
jgi:hypothetical protein